MYLNPNLAAFRPDFTLFYSSRYEYLRLVLAKPIQSGTIELDEFASFLGRSEEKVNFAAGVADGKRRQRKL